MCIISYFFEADIISLFWTLHSKSLLFGWDIKSIVLFQIPYDGWGFNVVKYYIVSKNCKVFFFLSICFMIFYLLNSVKNHSKRRTSKTSMIKEQSDSMVRGENPMALVFPTVSFIMIFEKRINSPFLFFIYICYFFIYRFHNQKQQVKFQI